MNKDIFNYGYSGDEKIEISAEEFQIMKYALEQGMMNTETAKYPKQYFYVSAKTGKEVKNPSQKDIQEGNVSKMFSAEATFSPENLVQSFDADKITREMLVAKEIILSIHARNVEQGVAKSKEELQKLNEIKLEKVADA